MYDFFVHDVTPVFVMQYCPDGDLTQYLKKQPFNRLDEKEVLIQYNNH